MKLIPFALLIATLSGCDSGPNLAELCSQHPNICNEFTEDSWCKRERIAVGFKNLAVLQEPGDKHKFDLLVAYENYAKCMDFASQIEHIKLKEKRTFRIDNAIKAKNRIQQLSDETVNTENPDLLFYHWSRYLDKEALAKFLKLEGTGALETPLAQFNLATYYTKRDPKKTLTLLFHALELYKQDDDINIEIFKSISTIFDERNEPKKAYIWLKMIQLYSPDDEETSIKVREEYIKTHALDSAYLDKIAVVTLDKIIDGNFKSPRI